MKKFLSAITLVLIVATTNAQTITIDGDPTDWPAVLNSSSIPVKVFTHDAAKTNDNSFSLGSKDISSIFDWSWEITPVTMQVRDIENAGAALIGNNLYFFGDRVDTLTDSGIPVATRFGVWFLKNEIAPSGTGGFTGEHSVGDILVLFEIGPGYEILQLYIYEWVEIGGSDGSLNFLGTTSNAVVNSVQQSVPVFPNWTYSGVGGPSFYSTRTFYEGYLNVGSLPTHCFKSFLIETRNSMLVGSTLLDFSSGAFSGSNDQDNDGYTACNDCDDNNAAINPGAAEICDGIDNNCNGQIDEGFTLNTYYADNDNDGFGNPNSFIQRCSQPQGYVTNNSDCNDNNNAINPNATEVCDGIDNNCNGQVDEGLTLTTYYADADNDSYGNPNSSVQRCSQPQGYVTNNSDCNDNNANVNPAATEICGNGLDDNCNGQVDEGCNATPLVSINDIAVFESEGQATLTITLSRPINLPVKISYKTIDGTAVSSGRDKDYKGVGNNIIVIPAGQVSTTISFEIYTDNVNETDEFFDVQLTKATNASLGDNSGRVTIHNGSGTLKTNIQKVIVNSPGYETPEFLVYPNPSETSFTMDMTKDKLAAKITMHVTDMYGRTIEIINVNANSIIRFGDRYKPGTYFVRMIQGKEHKEIKLIKL